MIFREKKYCSEVKGSALLHYSIVFEIGCCAAYAVTAVCATVRLTRLELFLPRQSRGQ